MVLDELNCIEAPHGESARVKHILNLQVKTMKYENVDINSDQTPPLTTLDWNWLESNPFRRDFDHFSRNEYIRKELLIRSGATNLLGPEEPVPVPVQFVARQVIERYCLLCAWALSHIELTSQELTYILNTTCGPYWQWCLDDTVAHMVAGDNGISSLDELPEGSLMRNLLEKLMKLDRLENAALVDFCERFWRTPSEDGFSATCAKLGLTLVD